MQPFGPVGNPDHLIPALARPDWDPEQRFSMPWQAGLTGIAYDARRVDRAVGSIDELFRRRDLDGRIGLLTEFTDTVGMALLAQGSDPSSATVTGVESAVDLLAEQTRAGRFAGYYGNDFIDALADGEVVACLAWSGDVLQAQLRNPYLKFVIPEEGLMIWSDSLIVPSASTQADAVAELAAYFYDPVVAARVAAWVNYICPVRRCAGGDGADRPRPGAEPADLPGHDDPGPQLPVHVAAGRGRRTVARHVRLPRDRVSSRA